MTGRPAASAFGPGLAALIQSDDDLNAAVLQVQRVRVSLASVPDDRDRLVLSADVKSQSCS